MDPIEKMLLELELDVTRSAVGSVNEALKAVTFMADHFATVVGEFVAQLADTREEEVADAVTSGRSALLAWQEAKLFIDSASAAADELAAGSKNTSSS